MKRFIDKTLGVCAVFGLFGMAVFGLLIMGSVAADGFIFTMKDRLSGHRCEHCGNPVHFKFDFFNP